jgi:predicted ABC-type ATPase
MSLTCYIIRGLSGSGKSTLARTLADPKNIFCTDDLFMVKGEYKFDARLLGPYHEKNFNRFLNAIRSKVSPVVVDNTGIVLSEVRNYWVRAKKEGYDVKIVEPDNELWVECSKELSAGKLSGRLISQLAARNTHGVGIDIIQRRANLWVTTAKMVEELEAGLIVYNPALPDCMLCDIDGTVAIKGKRSAYDWARVGEDTVNKAVVDLLLSTSRTEDDYNGYGFKSFDTPIIFFSGRDSVCYPETRKWLDINGFKNCPLYMRPENNSESDVIIKSRMFDEHIRGKYNVSAVFDDRNGVVSMWRNELGLTCLQVGEGDF